MQENLNMLKSFLNRKTGGYYKFHKNSKSVNKKLYRCFKKTLDI